MNNENDTTENGKQQRILIEKWGEHHWFMLFLIEDWCVWADGKVARPAIMRTNPQTHPKMLDVGSQVLADTERKNGEAPKFPPEDFTKLIDGSVVEQHDSWDCIDDLIAYQLVDASVGEDGKPKFELTSEGWSHAARVRQYFAEQHSLADYTPVTGAPSNKNPRWSSCIFGSGDATVTSYEDGSRNTKAQIVRDGGYLLVGENTGDFS